MGLVFLPALFAFARDNAKNAIRCGANDGQPSAQAFAGRDNEMVRSRGHGAAVIEEITIHRWTKRWTCFAKRQPGRAKLKFLAT